MTQTPWSQTVRQKSPNELATGPETQLFLVNENIFVNFAFFNGRLTLYLNVILSNTLIFVLVRAVNQRGDCPDDKNKFNAKGNFQGWFLKHISKHHNIMIWFFKTKRMETGPKLITKTWKNVISVRGSF